MAMFLQSIIVGLHMTTTETFQDGIFRIVQCAKNVHIQSLCWSVLSANTGKYGQEETPSWDTFYAVMIQKNTVNRCFLTQARSMFFYSTP